MTLSVYGIVNCDTVKKARAWLDERGVSYAFHDYKKEGVDPQRLARWASEAGWEALLNKRGTTFRKLPETDRAELDEGKAIALMVAHPSLIKRPVAENSGGLLVGFDPEAWAETLA